MNMNNIIERVKSAIIEASSGGKADKLEAYGLAISRERNPNARWAMEQIAENYKLARYSRGPLCDDTGIPHLILEVGPDGIVSGKMLEDIRCGIVEGLRALPGRPMAVLGDDMQRLDQSAGLSPDPSDVTAPPVMIVPGRGNTVRLHVLMMGSASTAIRSRTNRVFHMHSVDTVINEIVSWAAEAVGLLGCTPCTLGIGIGRSHYEATALTLLSLAEGRYDIQSPLEKEITGKVNGYKTGALGLGGDTSVLASFIKIGPQRASGVRVVCMQPCCCYDPRVAVMDL